MPASATDHYTYHSRSRFGALHPGIADAHRWLWDNVPKSAARIIAKYDGMPPDHWRRVVAALQTAMGANARRIEQDAQRRQSRLQAELPGGPPRRAVASGIDVQDATDEALEAESGERILYLIDDPKAGTPSELTDLDQTTDPIESRVERYAKLRKQAERQSDFIATIDPKSELANGHDVENIATNMRLCGSFLVFHRYDTIGENRLHAAKFCQHGRLCAFCSMRRMVRKVARIVPIAYQAMIETQTLGYMVTLTVKNGSNLLERLAHLREADRRLHERGKHWRRWVDGGLSRRPRYTEWHKVLGQLWSIEIKQGADSGLWHPHMHSLVLCSAPIDQAALSVEWRELTGDSFIVDVRPLHCMEAVQQGATIEAVRDQLTTDLMEVVSYALKFSSMGPANTWHAYKACHGKQLSRTRGVLRGLDVKDEYLDAPLAVDDLPFVEVVARWANGRYELDAADEWKEMY